MSIVKSFSFPVGDIRGDCFYIKHNSDNFTVIDCYLKDGDGVDCRKDEIIDEIIQNSKGRICRFISTHPDNDHILGIEELDARWGITNFYAVKNDIPADFDDPSLTKYIELKKDYNYPIKKGIRRKWLNESDDNYSSSGLYFKWPDVTNEKFKAALDNVSKGGSPNNISCILTYKIKNSATYLWMGDLETEMQQEYYNQCKDNIPHVDILFQPHHGRKSGAVPEDLLSAFDPKLIIIGNAPSDHIDYGDSSKTITQNSAGDIVFINESKYVDILTQNNIDNVPDVINSDYFEKDFEFGGKLWYKIGRLFL